MTAKLTPRRMGEQELSFPKSRIKILLLENIHTAAVQRLKDEGFQVPWDLLRPKLMCRGRGIARHS